MEPKSAARANATSLQMALVEHFAQTAMFQLNEIRFVLGLPVDMSHADLIEYLRGLRCPAEETSH